jgi:hypothetical protein
MTFAGKIERQLLTEVIRPAAANFEDMSYDVSPAKQIMVEFICKHCKIESMHIPPTNIDKYALSQIHKTGLCMKPRDRQNIQYLFCLKTGKVYVTESTSSVFSLSVEYITFDAYLMVINASTEKKPKIMK